MSTQIRGSFPTPFIPKPPDPSAGKGSAGIFSLRRRAHKQLAEAHRTPDDARRIQVLEETYRHLIADPEQYAALVEEILLLLPWAKLRQRNLDESAYWLAELERRLPHNPARISLRWQLMSGLREAGRKDDYLAQCKTMLADPSVTGDKHRDAVLQIIATLYGDFSRAACEEAVSFAHDGLRDQLPLKPILELCRCPVTFDSIGEARTWASAIDAAAFSFSSLMRSDALLVHARAAELSGDRRSMYLYAAAAVAEKVDHLPARYWLIRTKLYVPEADPSAGLDLDSLPDTPQWNRLKHLIGLHKEVTFKRAAELLGLIEQAQGALDAGERSLIVGLLKDALRTGPEWDVESVAECARLSNRIEDAIGRQAWTQVNIAIHELRCESAYDSAVERLQKQDVVTEPRAWALLRVARVLAGEPEFTTSDQGPLTAVERAMHDLLHEPASQRQFDAAELVASLEREGEDSLFVEFPSLAAVAHVLRAASEILSGKEREQLLAPSSELPDYTPTWARWLYARVALIHTASKQASATVKRTVKHKETLPAILWCIENWRSLYGSPVGDSALADGQSRDELESGDGRPPHTKSLLASDDTSNLGKLCSTLLKREMGFESDFVAARQLLRGVNASSDQGRGDGGMANELTGRVAQLPLMSRVWWQPAVNYWAATVRARSSPQEARSMLSGLIPGPKASEARAQLAMLAIQDGELESAERWVGQEPPYYPGVVYAQALLESRRGNIDQARHLLEPFEELFGSTDSPYVMGSRRLLAAIADRQGNSEQAESLYRDALNAHPDDPITSARLARLLVRGEYEQARRGPQPEDESIDILLRDALKCGDWVSDYRGLHRVMTDKEPDEAWLDSGWSSAWLQAITWQLLRAGRASDAYQTIIAAAGDAPRWQQRAKLILTAWHLLTTLWEQYSFATRSSEAVAQPTEDHPEEQSPALQDRLRQIASCAREIETLCPDDSDDLLCNWLVLLCRAVELCRGEAGPLGPSELWMKTKPGPLALLATVSGDVERNGANAVRVLLSSGEIDAYWNKDQLNLARAIDAYNGAKDEAFLDTFIQLQHRLEELPVDAAGFWLPAADIWLRRKNWKALLEDEMPDSIADLSDARVRLVIGLGYAQSSLDEISNGDLRLAQKRVRQARATLGPLIEQGEEDAVR